MTASSTVMRQNPGRLNLPEPLRSWAGGRTEYPRHRTIALQFEEIVARFPDRTALIFGAERVSYSELNRMANKLAYQLQQLGVREEMLVGLCIGRSVEMIAGMVAILKAGAAYVPFDPAYPPERLDFMLKDTRVPVLVAQKSFGTITENRGTTTLFGDNFSKNSQPEIPNPPAAGRPDSLAYIMYTSGSMGRPKGVLVENLSVMRLVFNTNYCEFGPDEVFLQLAPISFDASTLEIWGALLHGATLVVMPPEIPSLEQIANTLREHRVSTLWLTAGLFHLFVDERLEALAPVSQLLAGGDVLSAAHIRRVLNRFPQMTVINGYGPTEGTTFTCCHKMKAGTAIPDNVPLGKPISNTFVYILGQNLEPLAPGEAGELCAAGDGVARGYLNDQQGNARFLADPFSEESNARLYRTGDLARWNEDGTVEFLGRLDDQVKILGHRVEPGEIEAALLEQSGIKQVCVVAHSSAAGDKRLAAYYVANPESNLSHSQLREFLSTKLPPYLVPAAFVPVAALPLNPNGKVDRAALPPPVQAMEESRAQEGRGSQVEETVLAIWKRVLKIERAQAKRISNFP